MGIGIGIVLIVLGAIFAFALDVDLPGIEDYVLGWILIAAGVVAIILGFVMNHQRANTSHTSRVEERRINE
jgi:uncharacterized membrane protein